MAPEDLYIVISIDTDEDAYDKVVFQDTGTVTWKGVEEGIPTIVRELEGYTDSHGHAIRYTWFVRCDKQLEALFGDPAYLFGRYQALWKQRGSRGDEVAWHPHLYEHDLTVLHDELRLIDDLRECFHAARSTGFPITTSRMGRAFCSNGLVRTLEDLGLQIDSTALPGRKRTDQYNAIDWENTPQHPYHPSKRDYRVPGTEALRLLEVPMSMIETKATYDAHPLRRYVNLTFKNDVVRDSLRKYLGTSDLLVTIMHPAEVLPIQRHPLLSFTIDDVKRNLDTILEECSARGKAARFITMREAATLAAKGLIHVARG